MFFIKGINDETALVRDEIEIVLQVLGKVRSRAVISANASKEDIEKIALNDERIKEIVGDKPVRKVIIVPKKLVNIVV